MVPSTPLARPIFSGTTGKDVIAVKRALSRAGFMRWGTFTPTWGDFATSACHAFQKSVGLKPAGYGKLTHEALLHKKGNKGYAYDSLSIMLMHEEYVLLHTTPEQRIRTGIIQTAKYLYEHSLHIGYSWDRPFRLIHPGDSVPSHYDCSGFATECHYGGGAKNPNIQGGVRLPWNGEGYTGTLLAGGHKTTKDKLKPGDLVFYGFTTRPNSAFPYGSPTHVAVWEGDPYEHVFSMGHYPMSHEYYYFPNLPINCFVTYDVTL